MIRLLMTNKLNDIRFKGSVRTLIDVVSQNFSGRIMGEPRQTSLRTAGDTAENITGHIQHTSLCTRFCTNPLRQPLLVSNLAQNAILQITTKRQNLQRVLNYFLKFRDTFIILWCCFERIISINCFSFSVVKLHSINFRFIWRQDVHSERQFSGHQDREQSAAAKRNMDSKIKQSLQVVILDSQGCN